MNVLDSLKNPEKFMVAYYSNPHIEIFNGIPHFVHDEISATLRT